MKTFYLQAFQGSPFLGKALVFCLFVALISGCRDNPGKWPPEKVSTKIAESLELSDVSLSAVDGKLQGSGVRSDGETVSVTVTQHPESGEIRWDAKGDRGFVEEGYFQLQ
jgi:hypothetical protein